MFRSVCVNIGVDEFVVFRLPWPYQEAKDGAFIIPGASKLPTANRKWAKRRHSIKESPNDGRRSTLVATSDQELPSNFRCALKECPPPIPPVLLRLFSATTGNNNSNNNNARKESAGKLKVILRVAAQLENGGAVSDGRYITVDGRQKQITLNEQYTAGGRRPTAAKTKTFAYDAVFGFDDSLTEVCSCALLEVLQYVLNGEDSCLLSFGHTGAGSRNAFIGEPDGLPTLGVIPCAIAWVYRLISEQRARTGARFSVRVTAMEIYGSDERTRDLLNDDAAANVSLSTCSELRAPSAEKAAHYLDVALAVRKFRTDEEQRNSHFIFTLHVYQYHAAKDGLGVVGGRSRLHLINLGSGERCTKQGRTSLTLPAIGNVLLTLFQGQKHMPSKNSKLTETLRETVGTSQCKYVSVLASVSADPECYLETMNVVQISSRFYRIKRARKNSIGGQHSSGGESSCDDRVRRFMRRSASDPDCTTSSSEQSCDTVIFLGTPGLTGNNATPVSSRKHHRQETATLMPQRPSYLSIKEMFYDKAESPKLMTEVKEEWIDGPKARPLSQPQRCSYTVRATADAVAQIAEQSRQERVKEWIAVQEWERQSSMGDHSSCCQLSSVAPEENRCSVKQHWQTAHSSFEVEETVANDDCLASPINEYRYLEDIAEVDEDNVSDISRSRRSAKPMSLNSTAALLTGLTDSVSAAFSDVDGRLRILSSDTMEAAFDSASMHANSMEMDDEEGLLSDEELERAMEASLSSVRSHEILQKLKAEARLLGTPDRHIGSFGFQKSAELMTNSASVYKSMSSTCQSSECRALASTNRFGGGDSTDKVVSNATVSGQAQPEPRHLPQKPKPVVQVVPYKLAMEVNQVPVMSKPPGSVAKPTAPSVLPTSGSYRDAMDIILTTGSKMPTDGAKAKVPSGSESKLPKLVGSKGKKSDHPASRKTDKTSRSPLGFLRSYPKQANASKQQQQQNRGSASPGRRTSSGYDSGSEERPCSLNKLVSPYSKVTQPKAILRSSSGVGSENSSAVSSDPESSRPKAGVLHRTRGGRLSLSSAHRSKIMDSNRHSAANSSGYESTGTKEMDPQVPSMASVSPAHEPQATLSPTQRSPIRRWLLSLMWRRSKSAPQSPSTTPAVSVSTSPAHCVASDRLDRTIIKVDELKRDQEVLKAELRRAKERLCVPSNKWTYDLHVLDCMSINDPGMLEALTQETKILEKRVNACKSHIQMITVFDGGRL